LLTNLILEGQTIKINGRLYDKEENKTISNGVIFLKPGKQVTTSDQRGEFQFKSTAGIKYFTTQVFGYKSAEIMLEVFSDTVINIYLQVSPFELNEVNIISDSIKSFQVTPHGNYILTPAALKETPRLFSEPDLLKSFQFLPGVVSGKDGSSDIYVRGGGMGQNIILSNGCYFFLPTHLLGFISPYDLDFIESAELYKDYFPSELGGGASSIISLDFKKPATDSLRGQVRLGLLSSGLNIEVPLKKINLDLTAGLKRGNYSLYSHLLKKIINSNVGDFLPPNNYSFYDGYMKLSQSSTKWGNITYLFFGNYDNGKNESKITSQNEDTIIRSKSGVLTRWESMVHAFQWDLPVKSTFKWRFNLNYNRLSMSRDIYMESEKLTLDNNVFETTKDSYLISPVVNTFGSKLAVIKESDKFSYSAGISERFKLFSPNIIATNIHNDSITKNSFIGSSDLFELVVFISSTLHLTTRLELDAGLRLSIGITKDAKYLIPEPRLRLALDPEGPVSPHITYVKLSQFDHSVEGSNAGLRSMLWLPVSKSFGPEISDVVSGGLQGQIDKNFIWTLDGYYKRTTGMVDFKPGASFIFDNSFDAMLDRINGRAYGIEAGVIKRKGKLTGSTSYTYSRSKRQWNAPEEILWIPSNADRPHNLNITLKYYYKKYTSFGLNWVYTSGAPATIYMHNTSYGEWFETKNNIRYFDYHRLDLSFRQIVFKREFSVFIDVDIYNVYNRKNTFYFKETYDEKAQRSYLKNISLFPIMPSVTLTLKY
jgi:hypothetical protein